MNIGNKIKEIRKTRKLSQDEFAKAINSSRSVVSAWERGGKDPSAESIQTIVKTFGVSPNYLFGNLEDVQEVFIHEGSNQVKTEINYRIYNHNHKPARHILLFLSIILTIICIYSTNDFFSGIVLLFWIAYVFSEIIEHQSNKKRYSTKKLFNGNYETYFITNHSDNNISYIKKTVFLGIYLHIIMSLIVFTFLIVWFNTNKTYLSLDIFLTVIFMLSISWSTYLIISTYSDSLFIKEIKFEGLSSNFGLNKFYFDNIISIVPFMSVFLLSQIESTIDMSDTFSIIALILTILNFVIPFANTYLLNKYFYTYRLFGKNEAGNIIDLFPQNKDS